MERHEAFDHQSISSVVKFFFGDPEGFADMFFAVVADAEAIRGEDQEQVEGHLRKPHPFEMAVAKQSVIDPAEAASDRSDSRRIRNEFGAHQHGL